MISGRVKTNHCKCVSMINQARDRERRLKRDGLQTVFCVALCKH